MPYVKFKDLEMFYEKMGINDPIIFLHTTHVIFLTSEVMVGQDVKILNGIHLS